MADLSNPWSPPLQNAQIDSLQNQRHRFPKVSKESEYEAKKSVVSSVCRNLDEGFRGWREGQEKTFLRRRIDSLINLGRIGGIWGGGQINGGVLPKLARICNVGFIRPPPIVRGMESVSKAWINKARYIYFSPLNYCHKRVKRSNYIGTVKERNQILKSYMR